MTDATTMVSTAATVRRPLSLGTSQPKIGLNSRAMTVAHRTAP
jgi:hypothetical protein